MATVATPILLTANPALALGRTIPRAATLVCVDILSVYLAVRCAYWCWSSVNPTIPRQHPAVYLVVALSVVIFGFHDLYPGIGLNAVEHIRRLSRSINFAYLLLTASMVLAKDWWANSRGGFFLSWIFALALVPTGRWLANYLLADRTWWSVPVVILGAGRTGQAVIRNPERTKFWPTIPSCASTMTRRSMASAKECQLSAAWLKRSHWLTSTRSAAPLWPCPVFPVRT